MPNVGTTLGGNVGGSLGGSSPAPLDALVFDSGVPKPLRTIVRQGIIDLLQRLLVANGGYLQAIKPTATIMRGGHDDDAFMQLYDVMQGQTPCVLVALGDKPYRAAGDVKMWTAELEVHLYVWVNSQRGITERLVADVVAERDPTKDPGVEVVLEHLEELLIGEKPGNTNGRIHELRPKAENHLGTEAQYELWEQIYTVMVGRSVKYKRDLSLEISSFVTQHRVVPQLPTDTPIVTQETDVP